MAVFVALLRGINVGGKNMLPMRELTAVFTAAGCSEVRTYLQSGNVVFAAASERGLAEQLTEAIEAKFGFRVPVVVFTGAAILQAASNNPFLKAGVGAEMLHAYFLSSMPAAPAMKGLENDRGEAQGDSFVVRGRVIYLHLPTGMARSRLTNAYFDKALGVVSTCRNWKTVTALGALVG